MSFATLFDLEHQLAVFTGAPYVIVTDCCTHAIELCFRFTKFENTSFTAYTYLSIPMTLTQLGVKFQYTEETWTGEYQFHGTNIWDSARRLEKNMYKSGQLQCLSFGQTKPLHVGRLGAILTDNIDFYTTVSKWRSDGRDLRTSPWQSQLYFEQGFHYCPTLETCQNALDKLVQFEGGITEHKYPNLKHIHVINKPR